MEREILFRGKTEQGEWVEGYLFKGKYYFNDEEITAIVSLDTTLYPCCEISGYEIVIPETVGQFTGLTDKNGKKIFEGDIIKQQTFHKLPLKYDSEKAKKDHIRYLIKKCGAIFDDEEHYHKDYFWEVRFEDARFYPFADDNFEWGNFMWDIPFEVIGNIHDNPELLEVENG